MDEPTPSGKLARLAVYVDPALDKQLRLACLEHEPRLTLSEAVEEAVRLWLLVVAIADSDNDDDTPVEATR